MVMPPASATLRLLAFAVPAALAMSALQPLVAAATGGVHLAWAVALSGPALVVAVAIVAENLLTDRGAEPPWFAAWALLPGAFLLAGAASMCLVGALIELPAAERLCWVLLATGALTWTAGLLLVRRAHA
jgi:hypothetical protein